MSDFDALPRNRRADRYREQAARLRQMAEAEPEGKLRDRLLNIAGEYDNLADSVAVMRGYHP